jgi:uncharacterized protein YciI
MLWVIICVDKPNSAAKRAEHLLAHRKYLDNPLHQIFFSGPQESDDGSAVVGSLFIIKAPSRTEAQAFVDGETFYRAGVFESVTIRRMRKGRFQPELANVA